MGWIIQELRRKVYDYGPLTFDSDVYYLGDTIQLSRQFKKLTGTNSVVTNAKVGIWCPDGTVKVSSGTPTTSAGIGLRTYNFVTATTYSTGIWRAQFTGSVSGVTRRYTQEFQIRKSQRIWSDDELQNYLDKSSVFIGDNIREKLARNVAYTRYFSKFDTFEWATLYNTDDESGVAVTPTTSNLVKGEFTFTIAQDEEIYLEGMCYNIYAAAAECLEELAGDPNRSSSWSRGGISHRSQDPLELAQYYRRLAHGGRSVVLNKIY